MNSNHTELYTKYADSVFRAAFKITGTRDDAKDITQETFIRAFKQLDNSYLIKNPKAYLTTTAVNLALNYKRNEKNRTEKNESIQDDKSNPNTPEEVIEINEKTDLIRSALRLLPEKQQEAIILRFFSELKHKEIAQIMKIVEGSVRTHINRGLEKLKVSLSPLLKKEIL